MSSCFTKSGRWRLGRGSGPPTPCHFPKDCPPRGTHLQPVLQSSSRKALPRRRGTRKTARRLQASVVKVRTASSSLSREVLIEHLGSAHQPRPTLPHYQHRISRASPLLTAFCRGQGGGRIFTRQLDGSILNSHKIVLS